MRKVPISDERPEWVESGRCVRSTVIVVHRTVTHVVRKHHLPFAAPGARRRLGHIRYERRSRRGVLDRGRAAQHGIASICACVDTAHDRA
jgi:hypothetical protein